MNLFFFVILSHAKRLMKLNVLSSERRDKVYFGYAESRKTTDKVEHTVRK